jgi:coatomer subunit epsilon
MRFTSVCVIVHVYLSINRPDLAKKEFERAKRWAEDDTLLQLIESNIGLVTGADNYSNPHSFYTEQLGIPSISSPHILTARAVTRLLQNDVEAAKSDLEESLQQQADDAETQAANIVAMGYTMPKRGQPYAVDEFWSYVRTDVNSFQSSLTSCDRSLAKTHPTYPMVADIAKKAELYDDAASKFVVPPVPVPGAA